MTGGQTLLWDAVLVAAGVAAGLAGLGIIVVNGRNRQARHRLKREVARELQRLQQTEREIETLHRARLQDLQTLIQVQVAELHVQERRLAEIRLQHSQLADLLRQRSARSMPQLGKMQPVLLAAAAA
ncbi:hypothetical protein ABBQ32_000616 [Trebouxia sp. C0010 RCD-2024]